MKTLKSLLETNTYEYINEDFILGEIYSLWRFFGVNDFLIKSSFDFAKLKSYLNKNGLMNNYDDANDYSKLTTNRLNLIGSLVSSVNINKKLNLDDEKPVAELIKAELNKFSKRPIEVIIKVESRLILVDICISGSSGIASQILQLRYDL